MGCSFPKLASMGRCFGRRPHEGGQGDLPEAADAHGGGAQSQGQNADREPAQNVIGGGPGDAHGGGAQSQGQNADGEPAQNVIGGGPGDLPTAADAQGGGAPSQDAHEPGGPGQTTTGEATSTDDQLFLPNGCKWVMPRPFCPDLYRKSG